jgi:hypothetical protein
MGDLVFLDEYRIEKEQQELDESDEMYNYASDIQFNYLSACDIASLEFEEVRWIIRELVNRGDFEWRKEEAEQMISDLLEDREE